MTETDPTVAPSYTVQLARTAALYSGLLLLYIPRDQPLRNLMPVFEEAAMEWKRRILEGDVNAKHVPFGAVPNRRHETHRLFQIALYVDNYDNPRTPYKPTSNYPTVASWIDFLLGIDRQRLIHYLQHQREYAVLVP